MSPSPVPHLLPRRVESSMSKFIIVRQKDTYKCYSDTFVKVIPVCHVILDGWKGRSTTEGKEYGAECEEQIFDRMRLMGCWNYEIQSIVDYLNEDE